MHVVKPLLWLLEPYIVYKAYLWGARFMAQPFTWEGELDWFAFMLTLLLVIDVVALPLVIFYCPGLNPGVRLSLIHISPYAAEGTFESSVIL